MSALRTPLLRRRQIGLALVFVLTVFSGLRTYAQTSSASRPANEKIPIRVLIVDGQNNHAWATTTPLLKRILEQTGRFAVDVSTTPLKPTRPGLPKEATSEQKAAHAESIQVFNAALADYQAKHDELWAKWKPTFTNYAVVISNYNGESWPESVGSALVAFVKQGGGFVSFHAANNAFPEWPEYNRMIGVGGWGGRNEKSGPYLRFRQGVWEKIATPGSGGAHGPQHEFLMVAQAPEHPIMKGLPPKWMHAKDELYDSLRGPAENLTILASAKSDRSKEDEPLLMAIAYGQGRVFHTALGHSAESLQGLGFQVTFARGTEWAASGTVTLPAPKAGELSAEKTSLRSVNP